MHVEDLRRIPLNISTSDESSELSKAESFGGRGPFESTFRTLVRAGIVESFAGTVGEWDESSTVNFRLLPFRGGAGTPERSTAVLLLSESELRVAPPALGCEAVASCSCISRIICGARSTSIFH